MTPELICRRFQAVQTTRTLVDDMWYAIERYIAPYRGQFFKDDHTEGSVEWRRPFVYDATAVMASQNLASSLHSRLTSASAKWFGMRFKQDELNDNKEALEWLEVCSELCYEALQNSNFNVEVNETYQDLVNFGTSVIIEELNNDDGDDAQINFKSVPIKECYFEEDHKGEVLCFYRHLQWTPRQMLDFFKEDLPENYREMAAVENTDTEKRIDIIFSIYRRLDVDVDVTGVLSAEKRPWGYRYVTLNDCQAIGPEGGYYEKPAMVPRWRKTSGSMWGNSPAMVALADTLTLNRTIELNLTAVEKNLDPPILTSNRGLIGDMNMQAGGLNVARNVDDVKPFTTNAKFEVTYQEMNRLRENIESYFFIPQLILPPMEGTPATATEISVRMQQLEALIGPTLGRLQTDLLDPIVTRTFAILSRANKLPEMPEIVAEMEGRVEIEYISPIAKTQEASNVASIERYLMMVGNLAQIFPEAADIPDIDEAMRQVQRMLGVSAKLSKDQGQIDKTRNDRAKQQQAMQQGAAMEQMGKGQQALVDANSPQGGE